MSSDDTLTTHMKELTELLNESNKICAERDTIINNLKVVLKNHTEIRKDLVSSLQPKIDAKIKEIEIIALNRAADHTSEYGTIKYTNHKSRRSYEPGPLDKICASNAAIKALIWPFRSGGEPTPEVKIKLKEN